MGNLINALTEMYDNYRSQPSITSMAKSLSKGITSFSESARASVDVVPQYSYQDKIRPLFGKDGIKTPSIGDHPDFAHLKGTKILEYCPITTLMMDMEGSTRLNLIYSPEEVQYIKNAFICAAIELINCFDGHVHRIMGDAVVAFFGGKNLPTEDGIIDALNCASVLQFFVEKVVRPALNYDDPFGIRIGVDYGPKDKVLWSCYGYFGVDEVTATSFYVDVAAKLQHQAGRNNIMIGDSLKRHIDLPSDLVDIKMSADSPDYYVKPNLTDNNGKAINYRKYILNWEKYLQLSLIPQVEPISDTTGNGKIQLLNVSMKQYKDKEGVYQSSYQPLSCAIEKEKWIRFDISLPRELTFPYTLKFTVQNHGDEAKTLRPTDYGNHFMEYELSKLNSYEHNIHWESTAYRGLHYMIVEAIKSGTIKFRTKLGIYIK